MESFRHERKIPIRGVVLMMPLFLLILLCYSLMPSEQIGPENLDLEEGVPGQLPTKWLSPSASVKTGYSAVLTNDRPKSGTLCVLIKGETQADEYGFGNLMQTFDAIPFRQKRIRFRAAVRTNVPDAYGRALLWLRVDRVNKQKGFFSNMGDKPITDSPEWNYFEIVGDMDEDADKINIGLMLIGIGEAWIDDVSFEIVGDAPKPIAEPAGESIPFKAK